LYGLSAKPERPKAASVAKAAPTPKAVDKAAEPKAKAEPAVAKKAETPKAADKPVAPTTEKAELAAKPEAPKTEKPSKAAAQNSADLDLDQLVNKALKHRSGNGVQAADDPIMGL
jgi:hypothetical protein